MSAFIPFSQSEKSPDAIARRAIRNLNTRDGLVEISAGAVMLLVSLEHWTRLLIPPSGLRRGMAMAFGISWMALCLAARWVIKAVRHRGLMDRVGYVKAKPVPHRWVLSGALGAAGSITMALMITRGIAIPDRWEFLLMGVWFGAFLAMGRQLRFYVTGALAILAGIALAFSKLSFEAGLSIFFTFLGGVTFVTGAAVLFRFLHQPIAGE